MSFLILINRKTQQVGVVQWFKDPKFSVNYPCGPILELKMSEFRERGYDLVLSHFEEYSRTRITQSEAKPVFTDVDERKHLKQQTPIMISKNTGSGEIHVTPLYFRSYSLGGLRSHDKERCSVLRPDFSQADFWISFDRAFVEAG